MSIEKLKKKHLEAINAQYEPDLLEKLEFVQEKNNNLSKEATDITLSFCIDVLQDLEKSQRSKGYPAPELVNKIQELEKLIEK